MSKEAWITGTVIGLCVIMMGISMCAFFSFCNQPHGEPVNETILECMIVEETPVEPGLPWGYTCTDCHRNVHDPMAGVPSDKEFAGHKNLDCVFCHSDYDNPQLCISCHEGHKVLRR